MVKTRLGNLRPSRKRNITIAALVTMSIAVAILITTTFAASPFASFESGSDGLPNGASGESGAAASSPPPVLPGADSSDRNWPAEPPAKICANQSILGGGPTKPPAGAVVVPPGDNSSVDFRRRGTTYWFATGIHTLGTGYFSQIIPGDNSRFVGAPGAILDGQGLNKYAVVQDAVNVVVEYLTIQNFVPSNSESVVNHSAGEGWAIQFNTIRDNRGAGVNIGTDNVVRYNCLTRNGQYGFKSYKAEGISNITLDHNEISYNNTEDWETQKPGCGCTGGGKFWEVTDATVTNNYVHHNYGPGLWADTNDVGFLIEGNYIYENESEGIFYEISYNALIRNNTLVRNALEAGAANTGFPTGAIYISEAGSDERVDSEYNAALDITGNYLKDNWGGVVLWENANRFCSSPKNPTDDCTLVNPNATLETCGDPGDGGLVDSAPYYSDCRWKTKNVKVHGNTFLHAPLNIGPECTFDNHCGVMSVLSNWGSWPEWSPYRDDAIQVAITFGQGNSWSNNTYKGEWGFVPFKGGNLITFAKWQTAPYGQDEGSTYN